MVRSVTFEIHWHNMEPIYACSFQPVSHSQLRRVLDHNAAQAAGLPLGKTLADAAGAADGGASTSAASSSKHALPIMAGGQSWKVATAGADKNARIWQIHPNIPSPAALAAAAATGGASALPAPHPPRVEYLATLKRHSGTVNCVRYCPRGELLATTGDDGMVLLWVPAEGPPTGFGSAGSLEIDGDAEFAKEHWRVRTMARTSMSEIYDMSWAPDGETLLVGGTDSVARIINAHDGSVIREIAEHSHYVQGVAWDPLNEFIATQSSDRSVHVHALQLRNALEALGSSTGISGVQTVSRHSRMDLHRRGGSAGGQTGFLWDPSAKPPMRRASSHASHASDTEDRRAGSEATSSAPAGSNGNAGPSMPRGLERTRSGRSATPHEPAASHQLPGSGVQTTSSATATGSVLGRAATPTPVYPQSPAMSSASAHPMNPPLHTPSRRSSFSGSQVDVLSPITSATSLAPAPGSVVDPSEKYTDGPASATRAASAAIRRSVSRTRGTAATRSPSPVTPLPAIRAPPSPKQRMASAVAAAGMDQSTLARAGMRLYGDENFSGFFRRLAFSPDGALLVTPSGIFDAATMPASPTAGVAAATRRGSESAEVRPSPAMRSDSPAAHPGASSSAAMAATTAAAATSSGVRSTVYIYGRGNLHRSNAPLAHLSGHKTASLVVRFSPILYELREGRFGAGDDGGGMAPHPTVPLEVGKQKTVALESAASRAGGVASSSRMGDAASAAADASSASAPPPHGVSMIGLPYRMVFAVATQDSVWIYDTQQGGPLCCFSNMHYASFTDLSWSPDGQTLMMCSSDGYCSVCVFDYGELGVPLPFSQQPSLQTTHVPQATPVKRPTSTATSPNLPHVAAAAAPAAVDAADAAAHASSVASALGLGLDTKAAQPPTPTSSDAGSASMSAPATGATEEGQPKKKRRVALTLEGPLGS